MSRDALSPYVNRSALDLIVRDALALVHHIGLPLGPEQLAKVTGRPSLKTGEEIVKPVLTFWDQVIPDGWKIDPS